MYSLLLGGCGIVVVLGTVLALRGQRVRLWLDTIVPGIASLAYLYGLILPGQLTGVNAWAGPVVYLLGVVFLWLGVSPEAHRQGPARAEYQQPPQSA